MTTQIDKIIEEFGRKYGENALMRARDVPVRPPVRSGSLALDFAIGIGGLPPDRVVEVGGEDGAGKTSLGLHVMISFLDANPDRFAVILDTEHKLTMSWVETIVGAPRMERILLAWPLHMEEATNMYVDVVGTGRVCMVLLDSIGGSPTKAATEKDAEKVQVGGNALAVTKFARLASTYSAKFNCLTLCTNQIRADLDGFRRYSTPGGHGLRHACILRIRLRRSTVDKVEAVVGGEKIVVGHKIVAQVVKNQLAPPGRTAWWWFYHVPTVEYGFGIDTVDECVRLAIATKVIEQAGAWYRHPALAADAKGERRVQGQRALMEAIRTDDTLRETIVSEVMAALRSDEGLVAEIAPVDAESLAEVEA